MKNILLASTSTVYNGTYLDYILPILKIHFQACKNLLFIPYASPGGLSYKDYTKKAKDAFETIGIKVNGIHEFKNPKQAILEAEGVFTGGGNTFVLLNELYKNNCINALKTVLNNGTPYLGTSAGSNICGQSIKTTNDMPIVYPPSFDALQMVPFNINPHYLDPDTTSKHMGETRETRIKEFHTQNSLPVVGLREGSWIEVKNEKITLKGNLDARIFEKDKTPFELKTNTVISF
jgi:dipeptidase E